MKVYFCVLVLENSFVEVVCIIAWFIGPVDSLLLNCLAETELAGSIVIIIIGNSSASILLYLSVAVSSLLSFGFTLVKPFELSIGCVSVSL